MRLLLFIFLTHQIANAEYLQGITPIDVHGYITNVETQSLSKITQSTLENNTKKTQNINIINPHLQTIQNRYPNQPESILMEDFSQSNASLPSHTHNSKFPPKPEKFTTHSVEILCSDIGFNKKTERNSMKFYGCITQAMKAKFTEETLHDTKYAELDINIAKSLKPSTPINEIAQNAVQFQEALSRRNKIDCLNEPDYYKCISAIVKFKKCQNNTITQLQNHNLQNQVICYIKTAIRFPNPKDSEISVRNSYFAVCNHLIQQSTKEEKTKSNAKCNQILTKHNLLHLVI